MEGREFELEPSCNVRTQAFRPGSSAVGCDAVHAAAVDAWPVGLRRWRRGRQREPWEFRNAGGHQHADHHRYGDVRSENAGPYR